MKNEKSRISIAAKAAESTKAYRAAGPVEPLAQHVRLRHEAAHHLIELLAVAAALAQLQLFASGRPLTTRAQPVDALGLLLLAVVRKGEEQAQQDDADADAEHQQERIVKEAAHPIASSSALSSP